MKGKLLGPLVSLLILVNQAESVQVKIQTSEPSRVHFADAQGQPVLPANMPSWKDHFVMPGEVTLEVSPGRFRYAISRGPEFEIVRNELEITNGSPPVAVAHQLRRITQLRQEGWWSGETHLHRGPEQVPLLMQAEDLHIACDTTWWNDGNPWAQLPLPKETVVSAGTTRFFDQMGGEDERGGGALLFFGLKQPLRIAGSQRECPSAMKFLLQARQQPGVWVDVEKPFWWDMPVWVASGKVDSIGIAHNHMLIDGVLDNEAWGKPRDRSRYPGPHGNGRWTQTIYYHLLNSGIRIPPSAGSASGVLPNPVGYNRMYAFVEGALTWDKWWESVRRGRVFVSNGPLLRVQAGGQLPGHVFQLPNQGPLSLQLKVRLDSRDPIKAVEIIHNGHTVRTVSKDELRETIPLSVKDGGWFLVRAIAEVPETFRFASTAPFYVAVDNRTPRVSHASAQFFVDWVKERISNLKLDNASLDREVLQYQEEALRFWEQKVKDATCE
ncbi:MAG: CehA/McbA family metallohydrolase [Verrucomicrobia bacterium]|nr:CehA/McbA family metallohydrolase [Verrucomicrobiota bacterium]